MGEWQKTDVEDVGYYNVSLITKCCAVFGSVCSGLSPGITRRQGERRYCFRLLLLQALGQICV